MAKGITVDFNANLVRFTGAIDKATNDLNRFQSNASRVSANVSRVFGALGVGLSVAGLAALVKSSIDAADHINDLSKTTGLAVEQIAGLSVASKQSGADLDSVTDSIDKLAKNIGKTPDQFRALGISAKDPLEAFKQFADVFNSIEDPFLRQAAAAKALGKSWQTAAPLLSEGSAKIQEMVDKGTKATGMTKEFAEESDKLNDDLVLLKAQLESIVTRAIGPLIPKLILVAEYFNDIGNQADESVPKLNLVENVFKGLALVGSELGFAFGVVGRGLAALAAEANAVAHLDFKGAHAIDNAMKSDTEAALKRLNDFQQKVTGHTGGASGSFGDDKTSKKKNSDAAARAFVDAGAGAGTKDDPTQKRLDNTLKSLEIGIDQEHSLLESRNKFIELFNSQNLISIGDYYRAKEAAQNEDLVKEIAIYDQEIAALKANQSNRKTTKVQREDDQGKINDLLAKQQKLRDAATQQTIVNSVEQSRADQEYKDSISEVNAKILELTGNLEAAAAIRFDIQNKGLADRFSAEKNAEAERALQTLKKYTTAQAAANSIDEKAALIQDDLANKEARIDLSVKLGTLSEIGGIKATDEARIKSAESLRQLVAEYEELARKSGDPTILQHADDLKLKLEELAAASHELADRFSKIFEDSAASAFGDFIDGTKSASDAFRAFADDVVKQINRIVAQNLAQSLFGGGSSAGIFGGIGGFFGGLFGGESSGSSQTAFSGGIKLPSFDVGTDFVPHDMVAKIHKGERILTAQENRQGWGGAPNFIMNITTPDVNSFRNSQGEILGALQRKLALGYRNN